MNLIKSTGTFGFYTIISRILGYLRDILIAIFLGTGFIADAFFVAFRIPNTFRRLFAEGTFNAAFVPSYTSELAKSKSNSSKFAGEIFNLLFLGLFFLVLLIEIFMPYFVSLIAPGFVEDDKKIELARVVAALTNRVPSGIRGRIPTGEERDAAVLVGIYDEHNPHLILTRRSKNLSSHRHEVSFLEAGSKIPIMIYGQRHAVNLMKK